MRLLFESIESCIHCLLAFRPEGLPNVFLNVVAPAIEDQVGARSTLKNIVRGDLVSFFSKQLPL